MQSSCANCSCCCCCCWYFLIDYIVIITDVTITTALVSWCWFITYWCCKLADIKVCTGSLYVLFSISVHQCSLNHVFWCLVYSNLGTCSYFCAKALKTHQFKFSSTQSVWMSFVKDTVNYFIKFIDFSLLSAVLIEFFWKTLPSPYSLCNVSTQLLSLLIEIRDFC